MSHFILTCPPYWSDLRSQQCRRWSAWGGRCSPAGRTSAAAGRRCSDSGSPLRSQTWCWRVCSLTSTCRYQSPLRTAASGGLKYRCIGQVLKELNKVSYSPTQRMLKQNPCATDLLTSWSGRLSNPTCPPRLRLRFSSFWETKKKDTTKHTWGRH